MGDNAMNWTTHLIIGFGSYVIAFIALTFISFRSAFGIACDLSPAVVVYLALTRDITILAFFCMLVGFFSDCFSLNPLGLSMLSLFITGCGLQIIREMILRDRVLTRAILGSIAFVATPLIGFICMFWIWPLFHTLPGGSIGDELQTDLYYGSIVYGWQPVPNWGWLWKGTVLAIFGAIATPLTMWILDQFVHMFSYPTVMESTFRKDREIKRGRY